jgi:hypothetical protein
MCLRSITLKVKSRGGVDIAFSLCLQSGIDMAKLTHRTRTAVNVTAKVFMLFNMEFSPSRSCVISRPC